MTKDGVIVDTSVLISFFRGEEKIADKVSSLLQNNRVVTTGIIIAELLQGMKDMREESNISDILAETSPLEITIDLWIKAGNLALSLRRKGINLPLTDVAIAALAIEQNLSIFTLDKHFEQIPGVRVYK
ncbi:MAG: PIN domain-containing protein [Nitrospira sp.]|nr:PIN domain-containing protein [Nitrospira sp.]